MNGSNMGGETIPGHWASDRESSGTKHRKIGDTHDHASQYFMSVLYVGAVLRIISILIKFHYVDT